MKSLVALLKAYLALFHTILLMHSSSISFTPILLWLCKILSQKLFLTYYIRELLTPEALTWNGASWIHGNYCTVFDNLKDDNEKSFIGDLQNNFARGKFFFQTTSDT